MTEQHMLVHSFVDFIINEMMEKNSNCIIFIGGKSGKGKSYGSGKLGECVSTRLISRGYYDHNIFDVSNFIWNIRDLVKAIKNEKIPDYKLSGVDFVGNKLQRGSVIVIEEAGVNANSRQWHQVTNQALHFLSQTYRRNNYCTIFNAPDMSFVDVGVRKTIHIYLEAVRVVKGQFSEFKILVPYNDRYGNLEFQPFYVYDEVDGIKRRLDYIRFELPSKELVDKYEILKKAFNDKLYAKLDRQIAAIDKKADEKELEEENGR